MRYAVRTIATLLSLVLILSVALAQDGGSGAIKTEYGFLIVWNEQNNHYTMEVRGKSVKQTSTDPIFFAVDGKFLQVVNVPTSNFLKATDKQKPDDKAILSAHRDWEAAYLEEILNSKLSVKSSWQKLSNGKDALMWEFEVPASVGGNVKTQRYLSIVNGDFILSLNGGMEGTADDEAVRQMLLTTLATAKPSKESIDIDKLAEAIRKGTLR